MDAGLGWIERLELIECGQNFCAAKHVLADLALLIE